MRVPRFIQKAGADFQAETDLGYARGYHAAGINPAGDQGGPATLAGRWLDRARARLGQLRADARAAQPPTGTTRRLARTALAPGRAYFSVIRAAGYATAEVAGWYDGHRPGHRPTVTAGPDPNHRAAGPGLSSTGPPTAATAARPGLPQARSIGRSSSVASARSAATARGSSRTDYTSPVGPDPAALSRLSYPTSAAAAPQPADPARLPAAPARRTSTSRRTR